MLPLSSSRNYRNNLCKLSLKLKFIFWVFTLMLNKPFARMSQVARYMRFFKHRKISETEFHPFFQFIIFWISITCCFYFQFLKVSNMNNLPASSAVFEMFLKRNLRVDNTMSSWTIINKMLLIHSMPLTSFYFHRKQKRQSGPWHEMGHIK